MWGDEPQLQAFRERLRLLLDAHQQKTQSENVQAPEECRSLSEQDEPVETLMLLTEGRVAVDVHQGQEVHTLAVMEAVELLGEVGFLPMAAITLTPGWSMAQPNCWPYQEQSCCRPCCSTRILWSKCWR